jgi:hypothetical protein
MSSEKQVHSESPEHEHDEKHTPPSSDVSHTIPQNAKVLEVNNADLALALEAGPHLSPTSPRSIQLFLILAVAFMGSMSNGFDGQVMSAVNGMQ